MPISNKQPVRGKKTLLVKKVVRGLASILTCGRLGQSGPASGPADIRVPTIRIDNTDVTRRFKKKEPPTLWRGSTKYGPIKTPRPNRPVPLQKSPIRKVAVNISDTALAFDKLRERRPLPEQAAPLAPF